MRAKAHIVGLVVGILVAPAALILGVLSSGAGHGDYLIAKLLFPMTMVSTLLLGSITTPFILLAVMQYPIYGWFVGDALRPESRRLGLWLVLAVHFSTLVLNFLIPNPAFTQ